MRPGHALEEGFPSADDQHDQRGRDDGLHEPAGPELNRRRMKDEQKQAEGEIVEDRTDQSERDHKISDKADIPAPGLLGHLAIHMIGRDRHFGEIRQ